ncbi:gamma-glutamylcyclotransferase [Bacillus sp. 2205SS5-2]|uniref:gamma-glutamylcyclotransferase n=1 Tax=Bacillus sp. 2205SS5-2 TaxID=3109031 RepID=UPI00300549CD
MYLFVYGSLRKYEKNHFFLDKATLVSNQAWVIGTLYDTGKGYPTLSNGKQRVYGEVYEVNNEIIARIDALEGYHSENRHNLFERSNMSIHTDEKRVKAYVYFCENIHKSYIPIASGDWRISQFFQTPLSTIYYFAYGSCMDQERFSIAQVHHLFQDKVGRGILEGYSMKYCFEVPDGGRGDIVEDGGTTEGVIYQIDKQGKEYLYMREGVDAGWYRPALIDVVVNEGEMKNVLTFIVIDKKEEKCPPFHYAREILRGAHPFVSKEYTQSLLNQLKNLKMDEVEIEQIINELTQLKRSPQ